MNRRSTKNEKRQSWTVLDVTVISKCEVALCEGGDC
jgi:hypothetical protein